MNGPSFKFTAQDFAALLGEEESDLPEECRAILEAGNLYYRKPSTEERDAILLETIRNIAEKAFPSSGPQARMRWERGWQENLDAFVRSQGDLAQLMPRYVRPDQPIRLWREYVVPLDRHFECYVRDAYKTWACRRFLADVPVIYEFGCGPCEDIMRLARMYPEKRIVGFDWTRASCEIGMLLRDQYGLKTEVHPFDMFAPDYSVKLEPASGILLSASLEQLGEQFRPFVDYLIAQKPAVVVHLDSPQELYESDNILDYLAAWFARERNYLRGYVPYIRNLAEEGTVQLAHMRRVQFGNRYIDAYSYDIWSAT